MTVNALGDAEVFALCNADMAVAVIADVLGLHEFVEFLHLLFEFEKPNEFLE